MGVAPAEAKLDGPGPPTWVGGGGRSLREGNDRPLLFPNLADNSAFPTELPKPSA